VTETQTVDLAAWLTQIWDEEEAVLQRSVGTHWWKARFAANREILDGPRGGGPDHWDEWSATIRVLASAYADRPGFQEAWRA
jgi:hypothetical protein